MRITTSMLYRNFLAQVERLNEDLFRYNEQVSSGRRLNRPSDDPTDTTALLSLREELIRLTRYTDNIVEAERRLESTDSRLNDMTLALTRLIQLAEQGSSEGVRAAGRRGISEEVAAIQEQLLSTASGQLAGRYLFAGTRTTRDSIPSVPTGQVYSLHTSLRLSGTAAATGNIVDPNQYEGHIYVIRFTDAAGSYDVIDLENNQVVTSGAVAIGVGNINFDGLQIDYNLAALPAQNEEWLVQPQYVYNGTEDEIELQVDENTAVVQNVPGNEAFGGASGVPGGSIFDDLVDFRTALLRDDTQGILDALMDMSGRLDDTSQRRAVVGGRISNLRAFEERSQQRGVDTMSRMAELENVNLPEAISELVQSEGGLQAALQVGARIGGFNLFNFLS